MEHGYFFLSSVIIVQTQALFNTFCVALPILPPSLPPILLGLRTVAIDDLLFQIYWCYYTNEKEIIFVMRISYTVYF